MSIARALVASFAMFSTVFKVLKNVGEALWTFSLKRSSQKTFATPKFVIDTIISNWTSCRTIRIGNQMISSAIWNK